MRFLAARYLAALMCAYALTAMPSSAVELASIAKAASTFTRSNGSLQPMYRAALLTTSRQATYADDGTAYIKTGDIPAEWLRDASAQVRPYLYFAKQDPETQKLL